MVTIEREVFHFFFNFLLNTRQVSTLTNVLSVQEIKKDMLQEPITQSVIDKLIRNEDLAFYVASVSILIVLSILLDAMIDDFLNSPPMRSPQKH
jgi:hypothetical protein